MPAAGSRKPYRRRKAAKKDPRVAQQVDKGRRMSRRIKEQEIRLSRLEHTIGVLLDELASRLPPSADGMEIHSSDPEEAERSEDPSMRPKGLSQRDQLMQLMESFIAEEE